MKYCNKCKKDVKPVRGKCPDCGMVFDVKLKDNATPIDMTPKVEQEETNTSLTSGVSRFLALIIIFWGLALFFFSSNFTIPVLMFIISFLLFSLSTLYDKIYDMEFEMNKLKNKVKKIKKK